MKELIDIFLDFINTNSALWNFLVSAATIVYVFLTFKLLKETKKARLDSSQPYILADIILRNNFLNLVVHNHGNDAAFNIELIINPELNTTLNKIKFLPPDGKITQNLMILAPNDDEDDDLEYSIKITYMNSLKKQFSQTYNIDLTPLKGLVSNNNENAAIEVLSKDVSSLSKEVKNLNSKIHTLNTKMPRK